MFIKYKLYVYIPIGSTVKTDVFESVSWINTVNSHPVR